MRRKTLIFLLLGAFIFMMADTNMPLFKRKNKQVVKDSLEMAELIGCTADAAATLLCRARKALKKVLGSSFLAEYGIAA